MLARGAAAVGECLSSDCVLIAKAVLQASIRGSRDLDGLCDRPNAQPRARAKPKAAVRQSAPPVAAVALAPAP
jgi:hypothetical protein